MTETKEAIGKMCLKMNCTNLKELMKQNIVSTKIATVRRFLSDDALAA